MKAIKGDADITGTWQYLHAEGEKILSYGGRAVQTETTRMINSATVQSIWLDYWPPLQDEKTFLAIAVLARIIRNINESAQQDLFTSLSPKRGFKRSLLTIHLCWSYS